MTDSPAPQDWGGTAELPAYLVARDHHAQWVTSGMPDMLADLDVPIGTVWSAVQLALAGADQHVLATTLDLDEHVALRIIVATTEALVAGPSSTVTGESSRKPST